MVDPVVPFEAAHCTLDRIRYRVSHAHSPGNLVVVRKDQAVIVGRKAVMAVELGELSAVEGTQGERYPAFQAAVCWPFEAIAEEGTVPRAAVKGSVGSLVAAGNNEDLEGDGQGEAWVARIRQAQDLVQGQRFSSCP